MKQFLIIGIALVYSMTLMAQTETSKPCIHSLLDDNKKSVMKFVNPSCETSFDLCESERKAMIDIKALIKGECIKGSVATTIDPVPTPSNDDGDTCLVALKNEHKQKIKIYRMTTCDQNFELCREDLKKYSELSLFCKRMEEGEDETLVPLEPKFSALCTHYLKDAAGYYSVPFSMSAKGLTFSQAKRSACSASFSLCETARLSNAYGNAYSLACLQGI